MAEADRDCRQKKRGTCGRPIVGRPPIRPEMADHKRVPTLPAEDYKRHWIVFGTMTDVDSTQGDIPFTVKDQPQCSVAPTANSITRLVRPASPICSIGFASRDLDHRGRRYPIPLAEGDIPVTGPIH